MARKKPMDPTLKAALEDIERRGKAWQAAEIAARQYSNVVLFPRDRWVCSAPAAPMARDGGTAA
jgi:hypothetical protein